MKKQVILALSAFTTGVVVGGGCGYLYTKKVKREYEELLDTTAEEITKVQDHCDRLINEQKRHNIMDEVTIEFFNKAKEKLLDTLPEVGEQSLETFSDDLEEDDDSEEEEEDIYDSMGIEVDPLPEHWDSEGIDIIDEIIFDQTGQNYDKITLMYYEPDDILVDDRNEVLHDKERYVGWSALMGFDEDTDVIYVRNLRLGCDFEILRSDQNYYGQYNQYDDRNTYPKRMRRQLED